MNKYEFLTQLDEDLQGYVSEKERIESVQYYREYIESKLAEGFTESEVLEELGSAYSISKSIIEARGFQEDDVVYEEYGDYGDVKTEDPSFRGGMRQIQLEGWKSWLILGGILLVIIFVFSLIFRIFAVLLPFLVPFLIILFLIKLFSNR